MTVTGLQRNVIGMAFCCKKGGTSERQLGMNLVPTKSHSNYMGTTVYHGPNVILARHAGFEPATDGLEGRCSIRLS